MKNASKIVVGLIGIGGFAFAAASLMSLGRFDDSSKPKKKDPVAAALDTLEAQLQRRFHDRNNVSFGYSRVVRMGSRDHLTPTMDIIASRTRTNLHAPRQTKTGFEFEMEPGVWVPGDQIKQTMHPENEDERLAIQTLGKLQVAIYTAGIFDPSTGQPKRTKGPAYLHQLVPSAPAKDAVADVAARGWASKNDADELRENGWTYRVVKVVADDKSCVDCHSRMGSVGSGHGNQGGLALGKPLGVFIIGTKPK